MESKPEDIKEKEGEEIKKEEEKKEEETKKINEEETEEESLVKTNVEEIENTLEDNDLICKDLTWDGLGIREDIKKGLLEMGFIKPSKIQSTSYPLIMKGGHLIAQSKNGSGKTCAFGLGVISKVDVSKTNEVQAIIFAHTRELVKQIAEVLTKISKNVNGLKISTILPQTKKVELSQIIVTTPGSFENYFIKKNQFNLLQNLKILVLDEADFIISNEVTTNICDSTFKEFHKRNYQVQVLFFSATFSKENYKAINKYYKRANMIEIKKEELTLSNVRQMFYNAKKREDKIKFIEDYLKSSLQTERVIIFANKRDFIVKLQENLIKKGYKVYILMGGNMDPKNRDETIEKFNKGDIQILITTNVLARGYDEKLIKLVINFDVPIKKDNKGLNYIADVETYLHRIGRTGRFGTKGIGLTLLGDDHELEYIKQIEKFYNSKIEEINSLDVLIKEFKEFLVIGY